MKATILTIWMGNPLPPWMPQLIENRNRIDGPFNWLIMGENVPEEDHGKVQLWPLSMEDFKQRVQDVGIILSAGADRRKTAEVRPAYGEMFADLLGDSDFWGYSDLDVVFGQIGKWWDEKVLGIYDVLTIDTWITSGPLTVVRNNHRLNTLWMFIPNIMAKMGDTKFYASEELGFGKAVWDEHMAGNIRAMFAPRPSHDKEHAKVTYNPTTGVLYDQVKGISSYDPETKGREVIAYHFMATKRWPF